MDYGLSCERVQRAEKSVDVLNRPNVWGLANCFSESTNQRFNDSTGFSRISRYWKSGPFRRENFYWGWMPPHPTFFVHRKVYQKYGGFSTDLGLAADYELMLRFLLKHQISCAYIPEVLVCMRQGGASNRSLQNRIHANLMDRKAWRVNGLKPVRKIGQFF